MRLCEDELSDTELVDDVALYLDGQEASLRKDEQSFGTYCIASRRFRLKAIRYTDEQMRLVGELIAGIKTVKLNGWADSVVPLASLSIFWTYARLFGHLTASMPFSGLALLGILARAFNFAPTGIQYAGEAVVAVQRLQNFLSFLYLCQRDRSLGVCHKRRGEKFPSVMTSSGSLAPVLKDINFNVQRGQLIGITGPVGSGKSSLLLSGDTNKILAACGLDYDISRLPASDYTEKILAACGLDYDISCLPASDYTEGDRGLNLSGGQKAHIGLARACYIAPVVLLDDPFAAIDAVTTSHIEKASSDMDALKAVGKKVLSNLLQEQRLAIPIKLQICHSSERCVAGKLDNFCFCSQLENKAPNSLREQNILKKVVCSRLIDVSSRDGTPPLIYESEAHSQSEDLQNCIYNKSLGALIVKEDRIEGKVTWTTLRTYLRACGCTRQS
ncbi:hypothetical protein L7F22_040138 [Adiantum nelumboides]|nr:hypothetical protein [Adiantum nelumboides]